MPPRLLGPADVINDNAGTTYTGSGVFVCQAGAGTPAGDPTCTASSTIYSGGLPPSLPGGVPDWNSPGEPQRVAPRDARLPAGPLRGSLQLTLPARAVLQRGHASSGWTSEQQ